MTDDKPETKRSAGRPEKLIPPINAPFEEVLKAVVTPVKKPVPPKSQRGER